MAKEQKGARRVEEQQTKMNKKIKEKDNKHKKKTIIQIVILWWEEVIWWWEEYNRKLKGHLKKHFLLNLLSLVWLFVLFCFVVVLYISVVALFFTRKSLDSLCFCFPSWLFLQNGNLSPFAPQKKASFGDMFLSPFLWCGFLLLSLLLWSLLPLYFFWPHFSIKDYRRFICFASFYSFFWLSALVYSLLLSSLGLCFFGFCSVGSYGFIHIFIVFVLFSFCFLFCGWFVMLLFCRVSCFDTFSFLMCFLCIWSVAALCGVVLVLLFFLSIAFVVFVFLFFYVFSSSGSHFRFWGPSTWPAF